MKQAYASKQIDPLEKNDKLYLNVSDLPVPNV